MMIVKKKKLTEVEIDRCHRCGGLMVPEWAPELLAAGWRCTSCGERIDPVILEHRRKQDARAQAEALFSGRGKARLN